MGNRDLLVKLRETGTIQGQISHGLRIFIGKEDVCKPNLDSRTSFFSR